MFKNKTVFKKEITRRLALKFGKTIKECSENEVYEAIGEMTREYAQEAWSKSKEYVRKNNEKELVYFSMEFFLNHDIL